MCIRDSADGAARAVVRRVLVDAERRLQALNGIEIGTRQLVDELPSVSRKRLDILPLALGEDRSNGQTTFARPAGAGHDNQFAMRNLDVDILQVVLPRTVHVDKERIVFGFDGGAHAIVVRERLRFLKGGKRLFKPDCFR